VRDVTLDAGLHELQQPLIEGDATDGMQSRRKRYSLDFTQPYTEVLHEGGLTRTVLACSVSLAYLGTSCMSMNGDLPGLSKC